jgi:hypothetical protein
VGKVTVSLRKSIISFLAISILSSPKVKRPCLEKQRILALKSSFKPYVAKNIKMRFALGS